jgi:hypothetical protein
LRNESTGKAEINVTDERGYSILTSRFDRIDDTLRYFYEVRDELATNNQLEIIQIDDFQFECIRHDYR